MTRIVAIAVVFAAAAYLLNQLRRPSKWLGRIVLRDMSRRHAPLTDWALGHVSLGDQRCILDVGCGSGRTLATLAARAPHATVVGIDYAAGSIAESRSHNRALIDAGRIEVTLGTVTDLPEPNDRFDLVTAVETHYYWPDIPAGCREIHRVLRSGGVVLLVAECHRDGFAGWLTSVALLPLRAKVLSAAEHRQRLVDAGFDDIRIVLEPHHGWLCAIGTAGSGGYSHFRENSIPTAS